MSAITYKQQFKNLQSLIALILLCVLLSLFTDTFFTADNGLNVLRQTAVNTCIATGMTLVVLTGGIDLSVGSVLAFCGAVAAGLLTKGIMIDGIGIYIGFTVLGVLLAALLLGALLGWFNGLVITRFRVPPFVATLAMLTIARGFTMLYTEGQPISNLGPQFTYIGSGNWLGIPVPVWMAAVVVLLAVFITTQTRLGRYIYAIGGNETAARFSGIRITRVKMIVYALGGAMAALGGIIVTARLDSAQPNAGISYELDAIAAVVIGGTSLNGGRGTVWGTVMGAIIIGVLNNGLVLLNVSPFWQQVVKGAVILLAVVIDRVGAPKE
ncbi:ribose ABC transporter permease [Niabella terrae]